MSDEAREITLAIFTDEGLLKAFAALTHRLHAADRQRGSEAEALALRLRSQRDRVQVEILRRMQ